MAAGLHVIKPPLAKLAALRDDDVLLSVCSFVCRAFAKSFATWQHLAAVSGRGFIVSTPNHLLHRIVHFYVFRLIAIISRYMHGPYTADTVCGMPVCC